MARIESEARERAIQLVGYRAVRTLERGGVAFVMAQLEYLAYQPTELPPRAKPVPKAAPWWAMWLIGFSLIALVWLYSGYSGASAPVVQGLWR